ncbi:toxin-antitoxin system YwqK family antitoxin [Fusobacterium animalis]|uniref:toxin-antitoxin system YwqK family antitoxin n=1 Tax=Fusobacterium animalis TaxID=76859 RepID=UPI0035592516
MKIYEFENHLDNGITTFEFEITKKVDYFFNKKEIEDLIKRIERDEEIANKYLSGDLKIEKFEILKMYRLKYGTYKGLEKYIKLETDAKKLKISDVMTVWSIGTGILLSKNAKDYIEKKYSDYFKYIEVFYKDIPLYIVTELTKIELSSVEDTYKNKILDFKKISGHNPIFAANYWCVTKESSGNFYCLEEFKDYIEASDLKNYIFNEIQDSNTFIPEPEPEIEEIEEKEYYENGKLKHEGLTRLGLRVKEWKFYYENGKLQFIGDYKYGEQNGLWKIYYENGNIKNIANYDYGKLVGLVKNYEEDGKFSSTTYYEKGSNLTKWQFFYKDGKSIKKEGMAYDMGEEAKKRWIATGEWKYYSKAGKLQKIETYENGEIIKVEKFK